MYLIITILWTFFQSHFLQNSRLLSVHIASLRIYRLSIYPIYFVDISHCIKAFTQKRLTLIPYWGLDSLPQSAGRTDRPRTGAKSKAIFANCRIVSRKKEPAPDMGARSPLIGAARQVRFYESPLIFLSAGREFLWAAFPHWTAPEASEALFQLCDGTDWSPSPCRTQQKP